jgi:periplasmic protein TonB
MERPSHIDINTHQSLSRRLPLITLAICLQITVFWLVSHGLGGTVIHFGNGPIEVVPVHDPKTLPPAPPEPAMKKVTPPIAPVPDFKTDNSQTEKSIIATTMPPTGTATTVVGPDRAPVSVMPTHTVPPYPVIARRLGVEGKVTLRLTVLIDGHVGKAEVVISSGREDLDQTAQAWIVAHWLYKPALDKGEPAVTQTLATVVFSLTNAPK